MKQLIYGELNKSERERFTQTAKDFGVELKKDIGLTKNIRVGDVFYGVRKNERYDTQFFAQQPYLLREYIVVANDDKTGIATALELSVRTSMEGLNRAERLEKVSKAIEGKSEFIGLVVLTLLATADDELVVVGESTEYSADKPLSIFTKDKDALEETLKEINRKILSVKKIFG